MEPNTKNLWQRINAAQGEVDYLQKEKKEGMKYTIVSHDKVTAAIRPVLVKNGVLYYPIDIDYSQDGNRTQTKLTVRFVNVDAPTEFFDVPSLGYGIDTSDKGPGKAISYAVKYALLKTLGLETGDDPDLDQNVEHKPADLGATHAPSKAASRDDYLKLAASINNLASLAAANKWRNDNATLLDSLPDDWKDELRVVYQDKIAELKKGLAA